MKGICALKKTDYHHNNQQFNHIPTKMVCHLSCKRYETLHHIKQTASQGKRKKTERFHSPEAKADWQRGSILFKLLTKSIGSGGREFVWIMIATSKRSGKNWKN